MKNAKFALDIVRILLCVIFFVFVYDYVKADTVYDLETEIAFTYPENQTLQTGQKIEYPIEIKNNQKQEVILYMEVSVPVDHATLKGKSEKEPTELFSIQDIDKNWICLEKEKGSTGGYTTYSFAYHEFLNPKEDVSMVPFSVTLKEIKERKKLDLDQVKVKLQAVNRKAAEQRYIIVDEYGNPIDDYDHEKYICNFYDIWKEYEDSKEDHTGIIGANNIEGYSTESLANSDELYTITITNSGTKDRYVVVKVNLSDKLEEIPSEYWTKTDEVDGYGIYVYNYLLSADSPVIPLEFHVISNIEETNAWLQATGSDAESIWTICSISSSYLESHKIESFELDEGDDSQTTYNLNEEKFDPQTYYDRYFKEQIFVNES